MGEHVRVRCRAAGETRMHAANTANQDARGMR